jgi:23S rRNA (guanosine2251-2'-O)-methyltransferase
MSDYLFQMRQCQKPICRFRFPVSVSNSGEQVCPFCGYETLEVGERFSSPRIRVKSEVKQEPVVDALLDNIRSAYNVGSIFRTADGAGIRHLYLCGMTPTPEHPKVAKTALGAEKTVSWSSLKNGLDLVLDLKHKGYQLWAVEYNNRAESLFETTLERSPVPTLLIVGNELSGIDPAIQIESDRVVSLPMLGQKSSLNVIVAFGIAAYTLRFGNRHFNMVTDSI